MEGDVPEGKAAVSVASAGPAAGQRQLPIRAGMTTLLAWLGSYAYDVRSLQPPCMTVIGCSQRYLVGWSVLAVLSELSEQVLNHFPPVGSAVSVRSAPEFQWLAQDPPEDDVPPMDTFCVLVLDPTEVDHLQLRENERREHRSTVAEDGTRQWSVQNVNV